MTTAVRVGNDHRELIKQDNSIIFFFHYLLSLSKRKLWSDLQLNLKMPVSKGLSNPVEKSFRGTSRRRFSTPVPLRNKVQTVVMLPTPLPPVCFVRPCPLCSKKSNAPCHRILLNHCRLYHWTLLTHYFISIKYIVASVLQVKCMTPSTTQTWKNESA